MIKYLNLLMIIIAYQNVQKRMIKKDYYINGYIDKEQTLIIWVNNKYHYYNNYLILIKILKKQIVDHSIQKQINYKRYYNKDIKLLKKV